MISINKYVVSHYFWMNKLKLFINAVIQVRDLHISILWLRDYQNAWSIFLYGKEFVLLSGQLPRHLLFLHHLWRLPVASEGEYKTYFCLISIIRSLTAKSVSLSNRIISTWSVKGITTLSHIRFIASYWR